MANLWSLVSRLVTSRWIGRSFVDSTFLLEFVHSDIAGPLPPSNRNKTYMITFMEDYSNFTIIDFLSWKSEAINSFPDYISHIENIHQPHNPKSLRSDN